MGSDQGAESDGPVAIGEDGDSADAAWSEHVVGLVEGEVAA
jgi:hypothetical protein